VNSGVPGTLLICLALTVLLEEGAAFFFRIRGARNYLLVLLVNILTNPPAVLLAICLEPDEGIGRILFVLAVEAAVILTEGAVYRKAGEHFPHPWRCSFFFNLISYAAGTLILYGIRML
jgi:hypothetical protein